MKTLAEWRRKAMDAAGLRHLRKAGFHCFRRKFASELKDVPLKDLMALGGWRNPKTVIQVLMSLAEFDYVSLRVVYQALT